MAIKVNQKLNRREILYKTILSHLIHRNTWYGNVSGMHREKSYYVDNGHVYFDSDVKEGDLVFCTTSMYRQDHIFLIGFLYQENPAIIKDPITGELCNYSNERFTAIHNIPNYYLVTDKQHRYWKMFVNACHKVNRWNLIPVNCFFDDDKKQVRFITRKKWGEFNVEHILPYGLKSSELREYLQGDGLKLTESRERTHLADSIIYEI